MSFKSSITKEAEKKIKSTKAKEMNTPSNRKTIIITVVITLLSLAAFAAQALYFYNLGASQKAAYNEQVKTEAIVFAKSLKPNEK